MTMTEVKFARARLSAVEADGTFTGYASLFGQADLGRDMVLPGAFAASLRRRGPGGVKMLFQHDPNQPIGVWLEIREDAEGLYVKGQLTTEVARAREVLSLMRAGALDGLSIGYRTVRGRTDAKTGIRSLIEVDLWEISVVTFPLLPEARVSAVKAARAEGRLPTTREFERFLVQDAGLTRSEARTVIASGFKSLAGRRDAARVYKERFALKLRRAARLMRNEKVNP
jgi:HK97 family phage prohead protease